MFLRRNEATTSIEESENTSIWNIDLHDLKGNLVHYFK